MRKEIYIWIVNDKIQFIYVRYYLLGFILIYKSRTEYDYTDYEQENSIDELKNIAEAKSN